MASYGMECIRSGRGYVVAETGPRDNALPPDLCFAIHSASDARELTADSVNAQANALCDAFWEFFQSEKIEKPWFFHVVADDGDKSLSIFDEPADVKGAAMLTYTHGLEPDDQWLYLPALKRIKRISSRNKSGPFMGSTFAFEDLGSQEVEKYSYNYLREEACGEGSCHVVERFPEYKHSGYTRQVVWIDTEGFRMLKAEFYDRKKALLKTLVAIERTK